MTGPFRVRRADGPLGRGVVQRLIAHMQRVFQVKGAFTSLYIHGSFPRARKNSEIATFS